MAELSHQRKIRVAVIGVGYLGQYHAQKFARHPLVELVGVVDVRQAQADRIAKEVGTNSFYSGSEVVEHVDAVSIVTPTITHFELARLFLNRGKDVLVEKPMTLSLVQARILGSLADRKGRILQVGHLERFNPAIRAARDFLSKPLFIECHRLSHFPQRSTDIDVVLDLMIHDLDIVCEVVGEEVTSIDAVGVPVLTPHLDIANVRLHFSGGCIANLTASRISFKKTRKIRFFQLNGCVSIDFEAKQVLFYRKDYEEKQPKLVGEQMVIEDLDALALEIDHFVHCVRTRQRPAVSAVEGMRALSLATRIKKHISRRIQPLTESVVPHDIGLSAPQL